MSLSTRTQVRLAQLIAAIAEGEKRTEMVRQVLAEQKMFEPYTAFRRLDQLRVGELRISDLTDFMQDNKIPCTGEEASYIFQRFDLNRDGKIRYQDFVKAILPREDQRLRQLATLRESYYLEVNMLLPHEVEWALARLFEQEIKNFKSISSYQELLKASYDFTSLDAFRTIDSFLLGYITLEQLLEFTSRNGVKMSFDEGLAFFRVVDTDEDGKISYAELLEALTLVPDYFKVNRQILDELQRRRELEQLKQKQQLEEELKRSRELDELRRSRERLENIRRSQDRIEQIEELRRSRERLEQVRIDQEVEYLENLQRQQQLRRSQIQQPDLDYYSANRQLLNELQRKREFDQLKKQQQIQEELYLSRDRLQDLQRSRERIEQMEQLRQSRERIEQFEQLRQSRERIEQIEELRRSRERLEQIELLRRSRERVEQMEKLRRSRQRLEQIRTDYR